MKVGNDISMSEIMSEIKPNKNFNDIILHSTTSLIILGVQGFLYFYYLNNLKNIYCQCVSEYHHYNIKKYFKLTLISILLFHILLAVLKNNHIILHLFMLFYIYSQIMLIYHVRLMLMYIKKYSCNCAESQVKELINIINILQISFYIIAVVLLLFMFIFIKSK